MVNNVEKRVTTGEVSIEVSPPDTGGDTIVPGTGMHTIQNALIHYQIFQKINFQALVGTFGVCNLIVAKIKNYLIFFSQILFETRLFEFILQRKNKNFSGKMNETFSYRNMLCSGHDISFLDVFSRHVVSFVNVIVYVQIQTMRYFKF